MYRLAVCDDERMFLESNKAMAASVLAEAGIPCEITGFDCADELERALSMRPDRFDMLLLDILLGGANGVELAHKLRATGYCGGILFISSSRDYALEGYGVHPVHYLLKPLESDALGEALRRGYAERQPPPKLSIPIKGGYTTIPVDSILYIESLTRSVIFHTKDRDIELVMPLKTVKEMLPQGAFLQCHKSFLVPMNQIRDITRTEIALKSGQQLPVGRVYYAEAMSAFIDYMEQR